MTNNYKDETILLHAGQEVDPTTGSRTGTDLSNHFLCF